MQWHPLFAHLLKQVVSDYYEVETDFAVGDLPREADIVLLQRKSARPAPFKGVWRRLTAWNVLEFKGPSVSARDEDLALLVEVGLGVARRLNAERTRKKSRPLVSQKVSFWYLCSKLGPQRIKAWQERLDNVHNTDRGVWSARVLGHTIYLVSWSDLPLDEDSLPLHVLRPPNHSGDEKLLRFVIQNPNRAEEFGPWLATLHPAIFKEFPEMAKAIEKGPRIELEPLIEFLGADKVIESIGIERLIEWVGIERLLDHLEPKMLVSGMSPAQRHRLLTELQRQER